MLRFYIWMLICATNCQVHKILLEMNPLCLTYSEILYTDFNLCNKLSGTQWCQPPCIWVLLHRSSGLGRVHISRLLPSVMQETIICLKAKLWGTSMESSGECLLAHRYGRLVVLVQSYSPPKLAKTYFSIRSSYHKRSVY
jgi:hypothetical protein